jgi:hypothetical protein
MADTMGRPSDRPRDGDGATGIRPIFKRKSPVQIF